MKLTLEIDRKITGVDPFSEEGARLAPIRCKDYNATYLYGGIMSTIHIEIWNNEKYRAARAFHQSGRGEEIALCAECEMPVYERARELLSVKNEKVTERLGTRE